MSNIPELSKLNELLIEKHMLDPGVETIPGFQEKISVFRKFNISTCEERATQRIGSGKSRQPYIPLRAEPGKCCFCGKPIFAEDGTDNSPYPFFRGRAAGCCQLCNKYIVPFRRLIKYNIPDEDWDWIANEIRSNLFGDTYRNSGEDNMK